MNPKIPPRLFQQRVAHLEAEGRWPPVRSEKIGLPETGDIYLAPTLRAACVEWAVVQEHPDDNGLLYFVPIDDYPLVGATDVVIPRRITGNRLVLRCGQGLWAQRRHFDKSLWIGEIPTPYVQAARQTLGRLVRGSLEVSAARQENEADSEYEDWMREIGIACQALEQWLADAGCILPLRDFQDSGPATSHESGRYSLVAEFQAPYVLAAESGGILGAVARALEESGGTPPRFHRVSGDWRGSLYLRADDEGVAVLWQGRDGEPPVVSVCGTNRRWRSAPWSQVEESLQTTNTFPWRERGVTIRIDTEPGLVLIVEQ